MNAHPLRQTIDAMIARRGDARVIECAGTILASIEAAQERMDLLEVQQNCTPETAARITARLKNLTGP